MDNSAAALRLWNFLLSEEDRLHRCVAEGKKLVGTMKDLGTVPVMAYSLEQPRGLLSRRRVVAALRVGGRRRAAGDRRLAGHRRLVLPGPGDARRFRQPGALSHSRPADVQRGGDLRRFFGHCPAAGSRWAFRSCGGRFRIAAGPSRDEAAVELPGGFRAPADQVAFVKSELERVRQALETYAGEPLDDERLRPGIARANQVRAQLWPNCGSLAFTADPCPLPAWRC